MAVSVSLADDIDISREAAGLPDIENGRYRVKPPETRANVNQ